MVPALNFVVDIATTFIETPSIVLDMKQSVGETPASSEALHMQSY
jgi:hypothetical protein